ncbi:hypothetical protein ABIB40_001452 [Pedobacter sp. UYP30]|uniref:esterase-like activity of phytase family protein n=1 Tax=Pedobacter sp. UYP30 TaxID=1756400 RepID=UPI0033988A1D
MKKNTVSLLFLLLFPLFFLSCSVRKFAQSKADETNIASIKFLSEYVIPHNVDYDQTIIGGLSGIDYDKKKDQYYVISDDPSARSPARFYTARIFISNYKIDSIGFTKVTDLLQPNGKPYPKYGTDRSVKPDAESIRYNPIEHNFLWSSEGERRFKVGDTTIVQPTLTFMNAQGQFLDTIPLPSGFHFSKRDKGLRKNAVFEGLSYANNYKTLFVSLEEPRYEDSEKASFGFSGALTRILKFDVKSKKNVAQYAYNLDPLPVKPAIDMDWNVNGISEILALGDDKLLVMERAWAKGNDDHSFIKVYIVDTKVAENEIDNPSFKANPPKVLKKKLLFDFDSLNRHIDNFEGITFGPVLPNGHKSLIFCVDDNFSEMQVQQFFLFEVVEK